MRGEAAKHLLVAVQWWSGLAWLMPVSGLFNPVMWSLIVEVHFYATLPALFALTRRLGYGRTLVLLVSMFALIPPMAGWVYGSLGLEKTLHPEIKVCYPVALGAFAPGVLVAGLHARGWLPRDAAGWAPLGLLCIGVVLGGAGVARAVPAVEALWNDSLASCMVSLGSGLALLFVARPEAANRWGLSSPVLRWIGLVSYEWYLFHQPLFFTAWRHFGLAGGDLAVYAGKTLLPFAISLLLAALVYRWFSLPLLRRQRDIPAKRSGGKIA